MHRVANRNNVRVRIVSPSCVKPMTHGREIWRRKTVLDVRKLRRHFCWLCRRHYGLIFAAVSFFCRVMLCISSAYAVMRCPSVCLSVRSSVRHVREFCQNECTYLQTFSPSGSHTILFFPYQTSWRYSDGDPPPLTGVSTAGEVGRNRNSEPISGFIACCQRCDRLGVINMVPTDRGKL